MTRPVAHLWSAEQAAGSAVYVDDLPPTSGELKVALIRSKRAHAKILDINYKRCVWGSTDCL